MEEPCYERECPTPAPTPARAAISAPTPLAPSPVRSPGGPSSCSASQYFRFLASRLQSSRPHVEVAGGYPISIKTFSVRIEAAALPEEATVADEICRLLRGSVPCTAITVRFLPFIGRRRRLLAVFVEQHLLEISLAGDGSFDVEAASSELESTLREQRALAGMKVLPSASANLLGLVHASAWSPLSGIL